MTTDTPRTDALVKSDRPFAGSELAEQAFDKMSHLARTLERDQQRIALAVIEAAAKECEQESTGDGITGTYQASWGRYLAGAVRALKDNVDEIIGRVK